MMDTLFERSLELIQKAESMPRGDARQSIYMDAKATLEKALELVDKLSLFSDNETIDDIATADLKYLLIPAYLAKVITSAECGPNRIQTFSQAESHTKNFLQRIIAYGLGNAAIERAVKSSECEMTLPSSVENSLDSAIQTRNEKIEKFKKMQILEERISELERRLKSGQQVDDQEAREYYIKLLEKYINDSYERLECEIKPALFFERNRANQANDGEIVARPNFNRDHQMPIDPTSSLTIVRDAVQKQVFGLGYPSRPTVTVDEFISKKLESGDLAFQKHKEVYANSLQRYAEQPNLRRDQEEESDHERELKEDKDDPEELARKRNWDEFKDENKRGSGNRHNMG